MEATRMKEMKAHLSQFLGIPDNSDSLTQWVTPTSGTEILIDIQKMQEFKERS